MIQLFTLLFRVSQSIFGVSISESAFKLFMEQITASIKSCCEVMLKSVKDDVCAENDELRTCLKFCQNEIDSLKGEILGMKGKLSSLEKPWANV